VPRDDRIGLGYARRRWLADIFIEPIYEIPAIW